MTEDLVFSTSADKTARVWYNDHEEHPKTLIRTFKVTNGWLELSFSSKLYERQTYELDTPHTHLNVT